MNLIYIDENGLYEKIDIDFISQKYEVTGSGRLVLTNTLEDAGRSYLDRRRLYFQPGMLPRTRRDLRQARNLIAALIEVTPKPGQVAADQASVNIRRFHLAALREGGQIFGMRAPAGSRLDEVYSTLAWLARLYDHALEVCEGPGEEPMAAWRAALTHFYTRVLKRSLTKPNDPVLESFLADCHAPLQRRAADE